MTSNDLTADFLEKRAAARELGRYEATLTHAKFIKLAHLLAENYLWHASHNPLYLFLYKKPYTHDQLLQEQQRIAENWQSDLDVTHCPLCFQKFSLLVRKHHCRLCGTIVSHGAFQDKEACSLLVPVPLVIQKLSLNYLPLVEANLNKLSAEGEFGHLLVFRCCRKCKGKLFHGRRRTVSEADDMFAVYNQLLTLKAAIKVRGKSVRLLKEFESVTNRFRASFFRLEGGALVPVAHPAVTLNMYKSAVSFLQDAVNEAKESAPAEEPQAKTMTRREIRELREQLMVVNEQKFLVEQLAEDAKRLRRFDEVAALAENARELAGHIAELEAALGEHAFN